MSVAAIEKEEVAKIHQQMVFELVNRGNNKSGFMRKEDKGKVNPRYLSTAKRVDLPMTSRHYLGRGKGFIKTQYVPGANTIFVEDYIDAAGEKQSGLKTQKFDLDQERERAIQLNIHFKFGVLDLRQYGEDPVLVDFVNKHENNAESEAGKNADRTVSKMFQFHPMRKEEKAAKRTVGFEEQYEAMTLLKSLRTKTEKGFEYDVPMVDAVLNIIGGKSADLGDGDTEQKFEIILRAAKNGAEFMEVITESMNETKSTIAKAVTFGILRLTSKSAELTLGAGAEPREILKFTDKISEIGRADALAIHLLGGSPQALNDYNSIIGEVEASKLKEMSPGKKK